MSYQKARDEFIAVIVSELADLNSRGACELRDAQTPLEFARLILRNASTIQRIAETACNRELSKAESRKDYACQRRIEAACRPWGIVPNFSGDPRGACVKMIFPSGRYNSWGGREDGFCVPVR